MPRLPPSLWDSFNIIPHFIHFVKPFFAFFMSFFILFFALYTLRFYRIARPNILIFTAAQIVFFIYFYEYLSKDGKK
jgi:hypothetical protein